MTTVTLTAAVLVAGLGPVRADDKSRFNLSRWNPFNRMKKEETGTKTKQLIETLRNDPDEKKRKAAADDLSDTDPKNLADAVAVLVSSLKQDPSAPVRATAAESLGKIKPVSATVGAVLEQAGQADPVESVRKAAQSALLNYHLNGYRPNPNASVHASQTAEPPLAKPRVYSPPVQARTIPAQPVAAPRTGPIPTTVGKGPGFAETQEPPLASSRPKPPSITPPAPSITPPPLPVTPPPTAPAPVPAMTVPLPLPISPAPKPAATPGTPTIPTPPPVKGDGPGF